jgi:histidine kinase
MLKYISKFHHSLISKLIVSVGLVLLLSLAAWAYLNTNYQKKKFMEDIVSDTDKLTNTIRLGAHYAMMLNSRDDINQIIRNISKQKEIENIRIYNKEGKIKFSNKTVATFRGRPGSKNADIQFSRGISTSGNNQPHSK